MRQFGTEFSDHIAIVRFKDNAWQTPEFVPLAPLSIHPAAHVFHYSSSCFEGFKAYRWDDGKARIYRLHDHIARMRKSAASLRMPVPDAQMLEGMVVTPRIMGDQIGLHPIVIMLAVLIGAEVFGLMGIFLAVPATAALNVLLARGIIKYKKSPLFS